MNWNQKLAAYLSLAEPEKVWRLLDRLSAEQFASATCAKAELGGFSRESLVSCLELVELYQREVLRDSQTYLRPRRKVRLSQFASLPRSVRMAALLQRLTPGAREGVLQSFESALSRYLRARLEQGWKLSTAAQRKLERQARFDAPLFELFALRQAAAVAEWLIEQYFFGVGALQITCELSPLKYTPVKRWPPVALRRPRSSSGLSRLQQLAIVLMSLPPELSARLFESLGVEAVQRLTLEVARLPAVSPEVRAQVIRDVTSMTPEELEESVRREVEPITEQLRWLLDS